MSADDDIRVQLARIEGKQDVTNERLTNVQGDIAELRRVQSTHATDIQMLKADKNVRDGERRGLMASGRVLWAGIGLIPGGAIVGLLMKLLGN